MDAPTDGPTDGSQPIAPVEYFLVAPPGLEHAVLEEAEALGFGPLQRGVGGVVCQGGWPDVWRGHWLLRSPARILVRVGSFRAPHLAQLDKRARRLPWPAVLRPDVSVRVEASCKRSRIYHGGAAAERIARAIAEEVGAPVADDGEIRIVARIENDLCVVSVDASGEPLHKRGFKRDVGKAPMRETLAALFLRACGYRGDEPVVDPMCGSGTFVIEAAEIALGLAPGRARPFAFERLAGFDPEAWRALKARTPPSAAPAAPTCFGWDRDAGAVAASQANAAAAGVAALSRFEQRVVSDLAPPATGPGLVIVNPPYGARIGDVATLRALYGALGGALRARFGGWRVGLITSEPALARATGLPFEPPGPPIPHGPLRIRLYRTGPL